MYGPGGIFYLIVFPAGFSLCSSFSFVIVDSNILVLLTIREYSLNTLPVHLQSIF